MPSAKMLRATCMKMSWAQLPWTWLISLNGVKEHMKVSLIAAVYKIMSEWRSLNTLISVTGEILFPVHTWCRLPLELDVPVHIICNLEQLLHHLFDLWILLLVWTSSKVLRADLASWVLCVYSLNDIPVTTETTLWREDHRYCFVIRLKVMFIYLILN